MRRLTARIVCLTRGHLWDSERPAGALPRDLRTILMGGIIAATREEYGPVESTYSRKEATADE